MVPDPAGLGEARVREDLAHTKVRVERCRHVRNGLAPIPRSGSLSGASVRQPPCGHDDERNTVLAIRCTRCHRNLFSAAKPPAGARCPVCGGRLEATGAPAEPGLLPVAPAPVQRAEEGSYEEGYASLVDFVLDDPRRAPSREEDLGLRWLDAQGRAHRAAWVEDTGELTLIQLGPPEEGGGHVEVLGLFADREDLDRALEGWQLRCGTAASAEWLRQRASVGAFTA